MINREAIMHFCRVVFPWRNHQIFQSIFAKNKSYPIWLIHITICEALQRCYDGDLIGFNINPDTLDPRAVTEIICNPWLTQEESMGNLRKHMTDLSQQMMWLAKHCQSWTKDRPTDSSIQKRVCHWPLVEGIVLTYFWCGISCDFISAATTTNNLESVLSSERSALTRDRIHYPEMWVERLKIDNRNTEISTTMSWLNNNKSEAIKGVWAIYKINKESSKLRSIG